ncbi:MAG TPA: helix-turn-helix transcriptional regulator [Anaerolineae bacterium]|nr:helix-turn-helix transcriptional regulator [Anaerolineae bacterium]
MSPDTRPADATAAEEWQALGARLKGIREYLNLSQHDVATATGIPRSAVSDIERGNRKVDSLELRKFARLYRYPVGYLLGEEAVEESPVSALARAVVDLTSDDRAEVLRFAEFLRFSARSGSGKSRS